MAERSSERDRQITSFCNGLLAFEYVATDGYETAIEGLRDDHPEIASKLSEYLGDHRRHIDELKGHVRACGEEPRTTPGAKIVYKKPWMSMKQLMGARSVMGALVNNEEEAVSQYDESLKEALRLSLPEGVISTCREGLADERRHLEYCRRTLESLEAESQRKAGETPRAAPRPHPDEPGKRPTL